MKVTVDQAFWDLFPTARITVMSLYGIDNTVDEAKDPYFKELLDKGCQESMGIYRWRKLYPEWVRSKSGAKLLASLKQKRSPIFNRGTLKTGSPGREFYPINPLVDLYNSVSMAYALPCGEKIWINWWVDFL